MSYRIELSKVRKIMHVSVEDTDIDIFREPANALIKKHLLDKELGDTLLSSIGNWLTAHFASAAKYRQSVREKIEDGAEEEYNRINQYGLNSTTYGQQACLLDASGTLTNLSERKVRASIRSINYENG
jgi:hypothetical protein